ncbi:hypothetical protein QBC38DRAFT_414257 [Podospora fimiseda]|uniref:NmrA-like domain-containing protein n=1 Tax=Podospora fimiseda TaxID=252190 RepID=A0AAN7BSH0_9PEZI|nr:hypothetical protein QBC38DRAFT_414257 [Podospora fimiseda]
MTTPSIFITSATGCLGTSLACQLLSLNWSIHTTTRDPSSPAAIALSSLGVHIHQASWDSTKTLLNIFKQCTHLFLNLMPDFTNENNELVWGKSILSLAQSTGTIKHVVYSSGLPLPNHPDLVYTFFTPKMCQAKSEIEKMIPEFGFDSWTILQPGFFMANFLLPKVDFLFPGASTSGIFSLAYSPEDNLGLVDPEDIARFAVKAFLKPEKFHARKIRLAGEKLSVEECLRKLAEVSGKDIKGRYLTEEEVDKEVKEKGNALLVVQRMNKGMDELVDLEEVKGWGVEMGGFEGFLRREREVVEESYGRVGREI